MIVSRDTAFLERGRLLVAVKGYLPKTIREWRTAVRRLGLPALSSP